MTGRLIGGVAMSVGGLIAVGCHGGERTDTQATVAADERPTAPGSSITELDYVWVTDGEVVAVRRAPVPGGAYGAHGVDYTPGTAP